MDKRGYIGKDEKQNQKTPMRGRIMSIERKSKGTAGKENPGQPK